MDFKVDVSSNILTQFADFLHTPIEDDEIRLKAALGSGSMRFFEFPNQLELYHLSAQLNMPFPLKSFNPKDSNWFLLNINLSKDLLSKTVNQKEVDFQKHLPAGMLFYTPDTEVFSVNPPNNQYEIVLVRFSKDFVQMYFEEEIASLKNSDKTVIYEDLDFQSESLLLTAINAQKSKLKRNTAILNFLDIFIDKLKKRQLESLEEGIHPEDIKSLFEAASHLRNPVSKVVPSVDQLAQIAKMGKTKFKTNFKQLFGQAPIQYHQKIRMEYAKEQLSRKQKSPTEISYELGYSHPSKFTLAYKKQFGQLPSEI